ncbi:sodium/glutamate symporter [Clostridium vitabionis]|uniref:sodium/glutamate symporter n=1 Tax=Clostridium vitabionis TaxID=2784388 RepID=UPI00188ABC5C|nr:sodium/glutamate symporter [Clostridium vitabionis]
MVISLDMYQTLGIACAMLILGKILVDRISFFQKYCIPAPIVGGLIFAIFHCIVKVAGLFEFDMDTTLQSVFMLAFFCSIGYQTAFGTLKKGGFKVIKYLILAVIMELIQDVVGAGGAAAFHLDPRLGLCMGSIPLVGGHGTAGSFGPFLEQTYGVEGATIVAVAAATFGLISGCMIGGPVASGRIRKHHLKPAASAVTEAVHQDAKVKEEVKEIEKITQHEEIESDALNGGKLLNGTLFIVIGVAIGVTIAFFIGKFITIPAYIGGMIAATIIRNVSDSAKIEVPMKEIGALGDICLSLFLGLAMISLKVWQLVDLALPMIVILLVQTVIMWIYASYVVFNVMGRDYEAATLSSGFCGFGMGATPNAMANMQAVVRQYGPAPMAFLVLPITMMFVDFFNALIITTLANIL